MEGDRVRYWSVERSQWEEIPAALVDWDATHKSEAEQASHDAELKAKIHASDLAMRTKDIDVDRSLEIKPGLFLPDAIGFYALDRDKLIREMKQSTAEVKMSTGREVEKIMSGVALIPDKKTMEIPGERAAMRLATAEPEFFMRPADSREPRFPAASRASQGRPPRPGRHQRPLHRRGETQSHRYRDSDVDPRLGSLPLHHGPAPRARRIRLRRNDR